VSNRRLIVALDYPDADSALGLARRIDPESCRVKVGLELFTRAGPGVIEALQKLGFEVFADLKFHDIPNTVAGACRAAADLGVWMMNVHGLGGVRMLEAAREAVDASSHKPLLIGVTVLTSLGQKDLEQIGVSNAPGPWVTTLAKCAQQANLDGVVCSPHEAAQLRETLGSAPGPGHAPGDGDGKRFLLVTPGIRPAGASADDQRRVMTPSQAVAAGADYLVVGRAVTVADDPVQAILTINSEIGD
jgi:orotidine-5'-phosphate decarboxylase